jgi:tRNA isopentenyl-2-thiomethyl-A-37 hydroxylase MiaE
MQMKHRHLDIYPIYQTRFAKSLSALLRANGPPKLVSHAEDERFAAMCP